MKNKLQLKNGSIEIKNQTETKAELFFYGDIVSCEWGMWDKEDQCPESVKSFLDEIKDVTELDIFINSAGGSVFAGMAIYNMLKRNNATKTVYVDGLAGSISSVIAMVGDKIVIPSNAYLMIHKASMVVWGDANSFRKKADLLETIEEGILNVYKNNLVEGVDIDVIKQFMEEETWFTGEKAAEYFNIEVGEEVTAVACISDLDDYKNAPKDLNNKKTSKAKTVQSFDSKLIDEIAAKVTENIKKEEKKPKESLKNSNSFFELRKKLLNI